MNNLNKLGTLYVKSLKYAVPIGITVSVFDGPLDLNNNNLYYKQTCAQKIGEGILHGTLNIFMGAMFSTIYPVTGSLYIAHKLEKKYPTKFKNCSFKN